MGKFFLFLSVFMVAGVPARADLDIEMPPPPPVPHNDYSDRGPPHITAPETDEERYNRNIYRHILGLPTDEGFEFLPSSDGCNVEVLTQ